MYFFQKIPNLPSQVNVLSQSTVPCQWIQYCFKCMKISHTYTCIVHIHALCSCIHIHCVENRITLHCECYNFKAVIGLIFAKKRIRYFAHFIQYDLLLILLCFRYICEICYMFWQMVRSWFVYFIFNFEAQTCHLILFLHTDQCQLLLLFIFR